MTAMPKDLFCLPTAKKAVPAGPEWIHEVKYDGYRLRVEPGPTAPVDAITGTKSRTGSIPRSPA
jgi:hypothetical protein